MKESNILRVLLADIFIVLGGFLLHAGTGKTCKTRCILAVIAANILTKRREKQP